MKIKVKLIFMAFVAIAATSCTGNKNGNAPAVENLPQDTSAYANIKGRWYLENIVFSDSDYVRPSDQVPGVRQYIDFEDNTYFIKTNCNTFSGTCAIKGDSITLGDGAMTEMACDNMTTEDAIRRILPNISTVNIENDSVIRLASRNPSEYIVLRKATDNDK